MSKDTSKDVTVVEESNERRELAPYTPVGSKSMLERAADYNNVTASRANMEQRLDVLKESLTFHEREAVDAVYGDIPPLVTLGTGLVTLNPNKISIGWKRMRGKSISLSDILKDQYKDLVRQKDVMRDRVDEADETKKSINERINKLYEDRKKIIGEQLPKLYESIETCNTELGNLKGDLLSEQGKESTDSMKILELQAEIRAKEEELTNYGIAVAVAQAEDNTKGETIEILGIHERQIDSQRPNLHGLVKMAEAKVDQADAIIEVESKNLQVAESVIAFTTEYRQTREALGFAAKVSTYFNQNLPNIVDYIGNTPIVDEKTLAMRVQSIGQLREASKHYLTASSGEGKLLLEECYEKLGLQMGSTVDDINASCDALQKDRAVSPQMRLEAKVARDALVGLLDLAKESGDLLRTEYPLLAAGAEKNANTEK